MQREGEGGREVEGGKETGRWGITNWNALLFVAIQCITHSFSLECMFANMLQSFRSKNLACSQEGGNTIRHPWEVHEVPASQS